MASEKVNGNIEGIRTTYLESLRQLYEMQVESDCYCPKELIDRIAEFSSMCNREVSVYIARDGRVMDVTVGGPESVALKSLRLRRNPNRLSMIRCIHTHPEGEAHLSGVDRQALRSLKFDSMAAVSVHEGRAVRICAAYLGEQVDGTATVVETEPVPVSRIPQQAWMDQIIESEQFVAAYAPEDDSVERAMLISTDSEQSLDELAELVRTAGAEVIARVLQKLPKPDSATYIGSGKVEELALSVQALNVNIVILDDEVTGAQIRNLEDALGVKCVDRTGLILDIFAQHARTKEGKLQVELAQLQYRLPRLAGSSSALSRLAGGIGTRGPGESQLEQDRRYIRSRIDDVNRELKELVTQRALQRRQREKNGVPVVALVGYTNAGKSTLLNRLAGADVLSEDKLFATLDTTTRRMELPDNQLCLLTDTVGFINKLPHDLVSAFRATLEEVTQADVLVVVSDASNPECAKQRSVVGQVLSQLGAADKPVIEAFNKCDKLETRQPMPKGSMYISAKTGEGLDELLLEIQRKAAALLHRVKLIIPYEKGQITSKVYTMGKVIAEEYTDTATVLTALLDGVALERIAQELPGGVEKL